MVPEEQHLRSIFEIFTLLLEYKHTHTHTQFIAAIEMTFNLEKPTWRSKQWSVTYLVISNMIRVIWNCQQSCSDRCSCSVKRGGWWKLQKHIRSHFVALLSDAAVWIHLCVSEWSHTETKAKFTLCRKSWNKCTRLNIIHCCVIPTQFWMIRLWGF